MWRTVVAQREKDRLVAEEKVKKLKMKREKVEVMIILIAAGKTEWRILNCQNLQAVQEAWARALPGTTATRQY